MKINFFCPCCNRTTQGETEGRQWEDFNENKKTISCFQDVFCESCLEWYCFEEKYNVTLSLKEKIEYGRGYEFKI